MLHTTALRVYFREERRGKIFHLAPCLLKILMVNKPMDFKQLWYQFPIPFDNSESPQLSLFCMNNTISVWGVNHIPSADCGRNSHLFHVLI